MKQWMYPLMIVFAASCYGILSTIIKLAILDGFTAAEAVTSQYFVGFFIALLIFIVVRRTIPKFGGGMTLNSRRLIYRNDRYGLRTSG